jgi:hydrogenase maturation protease
MKTLFYGYGNPGRRDDGLGVAFVEELERYVQEKQIPGIDFDSNYQLNIEDADTISRYERVFFCDATTEAIRDFCITEVSPSEARVEFTMHAVSPAFVLDLCKKLYDKSPDTYLIHLKGYEWEFREKPGTLGLQNLRKALSFVKEHLLLLTKEPENILTQQVICPA